MEMNEKNERFNKELKNLVGSFALIDAIMKSNEFLVAFLLKRGPRNGRHLEIGNASVAMIARLPGYGLSTHI